LLAIPEPLGFNRFGGKIEQISLVHFWQKSKGAAVVTAVHPKPMASTRCQMLGPTKKQNMVETMVDFHNSNPERLH
jgi:hypothetical protein